MSSPQIQLTRSAVLAKCLKQVSGCSALATNWFSEALRQNCLIQTVVLISISLIEAMIRCRNLLIDLSFWPT